MPKLAYKRKRFNPQHLLVVQQANEILVAYEQQGFDVTLRQLYYQFVAHDIFPDDRRWSKTPAGKWIRDPNGTKNADPNYKWLGDIVNDARLSGLIDWNHMTDRTRNLQALSHWATPGRIIESAARSFRIDKWADQEYRVEVWVEKEALAGVVGVVCDELDVPYFACRGYTSQSEMWAASQRLLSYIDKGQKVRILHLGDHDPSGIDMTRDIDERLFLFLAVDHWRNKMEGSGTSVELSVEFMREWFGLDRLALNMDQIELYDPPPNPAKLSDSRGASYVDEYGDESWELDALEPSVMADLIRDAVYALRDDEKWDAATAVEDEHLAALADASERWDDVAAFLKDGA